MKNKLLLFMIGVMHCATSLYASPNGSISSMSRVYGNRFSPEIVQNPAQGELGTLNLGFGAGGSLDLSTQLAASQAKGIRIAANGTMFVALSTVSSTVVAAYTGAGILDTSFAGGVCTLSGSNLFPEFIQLDSQGNILIGGYGGWMERISQAGIIDTGFSAQFNATVGTWDSIGNVAEQSSGNLIIVGLKDGYTQVARLLSSGALDTNFGTDGYIIFNVTVGTPPLLQSTAGAYSVAIDGNDEIFVAYCDTTLLHAAVAKFTMNGQLATGFGQSGIVTNAVGAVIVVPNQIQVVLDSDNHVIIGATIIGEGHQDSVGLLAWNSDTGELVGTISPMTIPASGSNSVQLGAIMTLSNGSIAVISSDVTTMKMRVDQFQSNGMIDANFNAVTTANPDGTPGYLEFSITPSSGTLAGCLALGAAIAPNGQLFVTGYQTTSSPTATIPYLSQIYEYEYVSQVPQYQTTLQQGTVNQNFGGGAQLTYPGIVSPYLGSYRGNLQQHPTAIIEINYGSTPAVGDLLVGMYGSTNVSSSLSMMLNWLSPFGALDTAVGANSSGQLILENYSEGSNEFLYAIAQGSSGALYVGCHATDGGAMIRQYTNDSTSAWTVGLQAWASYDPVTPSTSMGVGVALQGADLVLMFEDCGNGAGAISGYIPSTGQFADYTSSNPFGPGGDGAQTGVITSNSYSGMNMGPVYGGVINEFGQIFAAYKNTSTGYVDIAAFMKDGSALVSTFGTAGIALNILNLTTAIYDESSVHLSFDVFGNLLVSGIDTTNSYVLLGRVDQVNGILDTNFGISGIVSIPLSSPTVTQLQGISDGSMILTGSLETTAMFVARVTSQGVVDTTFNSQGSQPGVSVINIEDNPFAASATGFAVKSSQGDLVVVGSQDLYDTDSTPMVLSVFGQPGTTAVKNYPTTDQYLGTLDTSFNGTGGFDLTGFMISGTAEFVYAYPEGSVYQGMILVGINNPGFDAKVIRFNTVTLELDTNFHIYTTAPGITAMAVDSENRIIVAGTFLDAAWAERLTADGTPDVAFHISTAPVFSEITQIAQQQSGRYIFSGTIVDVAYGLVAYQNELVDSNTTLQLDATFNPMGTYPGMYPFTGYPVYSTVINQDDTILASWTNNNLYIAKMYANASGMVQSFGSDGIANTQIYPSDPTTALIAIDSENNIIAAASTSSDDMQVVRYTPSGFIDNSWNPSGGVGQISTLNGFGHSVTLTSILESTTQQTILLGYNAVRRVNGINGPLFAVSLTSTGVLDETWNPNANPADVPGILTFAVAGSTIMGGGAFAVNGNVFAVGGSGDGHPLIMEIVAHGLSAAQDPLATDAGILDSTINTQRTGFDSLNLNSQLGLTLGTPKQLHIMNNSNGAMIMTSFLGTTAYISKMNADLSLDTNFNSGGSPSGTIAIPSILSIADLFVADASGDSGTIYVTGNVAGPSIWAQLISADGSVQTQLTAANSLTQATAIRQGTGNILVAGYAGSTGIIAAFTQDLSALDSSFGDGGYYTTAVNNPIGAMTLDNQSRIYIAYKVPIEGTLMVQRILANGSGIDGAFTAATMPSSCDAYQIKLVLDQAHNQLIVADYYYNGIIISRYSTVDGSSTGSASLNIDDGNLQLSDLIVDTNQNIYVVGYNTNSPSQTFVVRYNGSDSTTSIGPDATYGIGGIANVPISPISSSGYSIGAGILHPDGRIYVVGAASDNIPYMARFFGDNYYTEISQSFPITQTPGDFDTTYGDGNGYAVNYAGGASSPTNQQVKAIRHINGTNLMTAIDDGVNSWTVRVLQNGTNDPSYGDGNGFAIAQLDGNESVATMIVSGGGEYFVIGSSASNGGYLKKISASGSMDGLFGGFTGQPATAFYPTGTVYGLMSDPMAVAELTNGNIVVVGNNAGVGTMQMVGPTGIVSMTFGIAGKVISGNNITSVSADDSNNLYVSVGYTVGEYIAVRVMKLDQNGSLVSSFGSGGIVDRVLLGIADLNNIRLAFDIDGKILVAASAVSPVGEFGVVQLEPDGTITPGFNDGHQLNIVLPNSSTAVANITDIVTLQGRKILISGYQQDNDTPANNAEFVACITNDGALDTTFNEYDEQGSIPGISMFQIASVVQLSRKLYNMDVQANGQIVLAGAESPAEGQQTPLTIRLIGYTNQQAIMQYPGDVPVTPTVLNPLFNGNGVATTGNAIHEVLAQGGPVVLDSAGNAIIVGVTTDTFVISRFLADGTFDTTFGIDGIATSPTVSGLLADCSIAIDNFNNVYVGSITSDTNQFVVVKFDSTGTLVADYGVGGTPGVSLTHPSFDVSLVSGGQIAIGIGVGTIIIAGYASTGQFAMNQLDSTGAVLQAALSGEIPNLMSGGFVAIDTLHNLFISGALSSGGLVVVKFSYTSGIFTQNTSFGASGIASAAITDLVDGGTIALDLLGNIVIGGYTSDQTFAVARFLPNGNLDPFFNSTGIVYSQPISSLLGVGSIGVGSLNNVIIGGYARDYSGLNSMVVAVFTVFGAPNTLFSPTGTATTGDLLLRSAPFNLRSGGFVAITPVGQIILGGMQAPSVMFPVSRLVVAEMYSGYEIFIADTTTLTPQQLKVFYYGNDPGFLHSILSVEFLSHVISNEVTRLNVVARVMANIDAFIATYSGIPGYNLVWLLFLNIHSLQELEVALLVIHESSTIEISEFFDRLTSRIHSMQLAA